MGHTTRDCYHPTKLTSYPTRFSGNRFEKRQAPSLQAHFASPSSIVDPSLVLDIGATHNVTNQLKNLFVHSDYNGDGKLTVGNSMTLPINHSGSCTLPISSSSLCLSNVLVVPHITKKLLSISQFTKYNNTYVEFRPKHCLVRNAEVRSYSQATLTMDSIILLSHHNPLLKYSLANEHPWTGRIDDLDTLI